MKRKPTSAELRLWIARIRTERAAGTPEAEANQILARMIQSWIAVRDNYAAVASTATGGQEANRDANSHSS